MKRESVARTDEPVVERQEQEGPLDLSRLKQEVRAATQQIILIGNPNVGKSVLFKNLTGQRVHISNYPGTTVEISRGRARLNGHVAELFDTPGLNDLAQQSEDARVTLEIIEQYPEAVLVQVADAKNLRRALLLTQQLAELGRPLVLILNMMDELERCGAKIDTRKLSDLLGVPVVSTVAIRNAGMDSVIEALPVARTPHLLCRYQEQFKRRDLWFRYRVYGYQQYNIIQHWEWTCGRW